MESRRDSDFDLLSTRISDGFDGVHGALDQQSKRLDAIVAHLATLNGRMGKVEDRVLLTERRLDDGGLRSARSDGRMDMVKPLVAFVSNPSLWKVVLILLTLYVGVDKLPVLAQTITGHG